MTDLAYRARRDHLAGLAAAWQAGEPIPTPDYSAAEHGVWAAVSSSLEELHERLVEAAHTGLDELGPQFGAANGGAKAWPCGP